AVIDDGDEYHPSELYNIQCELRAITMLLETFGQVSDMPGTTKDTKRRHMDVYDTIQPSEREELMIEGSDMQTDCISESQDLFHHAFIRHTVNDMQQTIMSYRRPPHQRSDVLRDV